MILKRSLQRKEISKFFITALAALFVFSLSFHNHSYEESNTDQIDSHLAESHIVEDCSACILQSNLEPPESKYSFSNNDLGYLITYSTIDFVVPISYLDLGKPSRAPPSV